MAGVHILNLFHRHPLLPHDVHILRVVRDVPHIDFPLPAGVLLTAGDAGTAFHPAVLELGVYIHDDLGGRDGGVLVEGVGGALAGGAVIRRLNKKLKNK